MKSKNRSFIGVSLFVLLCVLTCVALALCLSSCNVTRCITNESQYFQRGDTSVMIQTKTIETYDASKR